MSGWIQAAMQQNTSNADQNWVSHLNVKQFWGTVTAVFLIVVRSLYLQNK